MPLLFEGVPGRVLSIDDPTTHGMLPLVTVKPGNISFKEQSSIITHVSLSHGTNHQFLHTLGGDIYVYVFGDRVGQMQIAGLCFAADCDAPNADHGVEYMIKWYDQYKLSVRKEKVTVMLGHTPVDGFITDVNFGTYDTKLMLVQFTLGMHIVPEKRTT